MKIKSVLAVILMCCLVSVAEESGAEMLPQKLTLAAAKSIALKNNPSLQVTLARIQAALSRLSQAESQYMPTLSVKGGLSRTFKTPRAYDAAEDAEPYNTKQLGLEGSWMVFDGMARRYRRIAQEIGQNIAELNHEDAKRKLLLAVASAYYDALLERQNVIIAIDDLGYNKKLQDNAEKKLKHGTGTKSDVLNFEIQAKNAEGNRLTAEVNYTVSVLALAELLGVNPSQIPEGMELETVEDYLKAKPLPSFDALYEYAFEHRPDLQAANEGIRQQMANEEIYKGEYYPTVSVNGNYGWTCRHDTSWGHGTDASVGITANWTIFNGNQTRAKVAEATAARMEYEASRQSLLQSVRHDISKQLTQIHQAKILADLKSDTQELAMQARDLVQKEYDIGRVTATRLNEAQTDYTNAKGAYAKAVISYWRSRQNLEATTGRILDIQKDTASEK